MFHSPPKEKRWKHKKMAVGDEFSEKSLFIFWKVLEFNIGALNNALVYLEELLHQLKWVPFNDSEFNIFTG